MHARMSQNYQPSTGCQQVPGSIMFCWHPNPKVSSMFSLTWQDLSAPVPEPTMTIRRGSCSSTGRACGALQCWQPYETTSLGHQSCYSPWLSMSPNSNHMLNAAQYNFIMGHKWSWFRLCHASALESTGAASMDTNKRLQEMAPMSPMSPVSSTHVTHPWHPRMAHPHGHVSRGGSGQAAVREPG